MKFNRSLIEKNKALVKKVINLRESVDILQNAIDDFMKSIFIVYKNLVINALTSSTLINFNNDENMIHDNINDEDIINKKNDD